MLNRLKETLTRANAADEYALAEKAHREAAEAAWRAELTGLGDRIAKAIIDDARRYVADCDPGDLGMLQNADRSAAIARRTAREAVVTLPDHTIVEAAQRAPGRHRSQADQR